MKVPLSWLAEFVDVGLDLEALVDAMSLNGLEVDEVTHPGAGTSGVLTARVLDHAPHPNADKLQVVHVTHGPEHDDDVVELVCGAWNFATGDIVAHAGVGATLPGGLELTARELRGVVSNGMLCSASELELGEDHDGIMILAPHTPLGVDLLEVLPLGEPVIDIAVLADRGDHHSILGIAREVAAILDLPLREPVPLTDLEPTGDGLPITIEAPEGCSRFVAQAVDDVQIAPSPWWLRRRLAACGVRAINTVVDITNYVMLELGQPLHAFDLDTLHGPAIRVRRAEDGERFTTLDDRERTLVAGDLVVADADRSVGLAGVMGGAETEVSAASTRVLIEGATWNPATIRSTSRRLGLVSEASIRFERRVDPGIAGSAVARAVQLLGDIAGGTPGAISIAGDLAPAHRPIELDAVATATFLGIADLDAATQAGHLEREGCTVVREGDRLTVTPPSWRGDLERPIDLVEEVARLHGYDHIPATMPRVTGTGLLTASQRAERAVRAACLAAGLHEVYLRPFVGESTLVGVAPDDGRVSLANPLAKDASRLRPSLLDGLLGAARHNVGRGRQGVALFELGRIFRPAGGALDHLLDGFGARWRWRDPDGGDLPTQPRTLGLIAQGLRLGDDWLDAGQTWDVYDLLAVLDEVVARLLPAEGEPRRLEREATRRDGLHPGRTALLRLDGIEIGIVGQLHPRLAEERDLPEPVVVAELLLEPLLAEIVPEIAPTRAVTLPSHPAVTIDVALIAPDELSYAELDRVVREGAGDLLDGSWWFDEYRGEQVGEGARSVAIRLRLQSPDRQLADADAERVIAAIAERAASVGATMRT